jgi:hypothetical protein
MFIGCPISVAFFSAAAMTLLASLSVSMKTSFNDLANADLVNPYQASSPPSMRQVWRHDSNSRFRNFPEVSSPEIKHVQALPPGKKIGKPRKIAQTENCWRHERMNGRRAGQAIKT